MPSLVLHLNSQPELEPLARSSAQALRGRQLDQFLRGVERRALRMAEFACGNRDDALEIVQDGMLAFVRKYAAKPDAEWAPLFYRVLDSRIVDHQRRQNIRSRWRAWLSPGRADAADAADPLASIPDPREPGPLQRLADVETGTALEDALAALPHRQRQCFLLRIWEGLDVAATAQAMRCSEGSVKTHLSRALGALRMQLEAYHD
ncbi:MAG: RNA polymerase sigma factor [Lysobacterales bacterium]